MEKRNSVFECQECGYASPKWLGRCPDCGGWNSLVEERRERGRPGGKRTARPARLGDISTEAIPRIDTRNPEFNRTLGGGIVPGSLILLGGEPGVGKSTLLLQIARSLEGMSVLYASGEESMQQIRLRADRLGEPPAGAGELYLLADSSLEGILAAVEEVKPGALVVDSVQTACSESLESAPGSMSQVRHVAVTLLNLAKRTHLPVFLIGHVTKDGAIAGPKALEHIVDVVLYFEGEGKRNHRIIRAVKNRFGRPTRSASSR